MALLVKNLPANVGSITDRGLIPGLGRYPGERHGNPLQYSCPEKPMDRGAWQAAVHGVTKSRTQLEQLSMHAEEISIQIAINGHKYSSKSVS